MLLARDRSQLLVVDVQERLVPAMTGHEELLRHVGILVEAARSLEVPVAATEQYPRGLGPTVAAVKDRLGDAAVFEKLSFDSLAEPSIDRHCAELKRRGRPQLVICGVEAHVCVLQSAIAAASRGYDVAVVADAVASRRTASLDIALARLSRAGVSVVTTEMVVFEWLGRADAPQFKALSALIR